MKVTEQRFLRHQANFYQVVNVADLSIMFGVNSAVTPSDDFLENFTGDNERPPTDWYEFTCLYEENIDAFLREKFGLSELQSGAVYLSPLQLEAIFGTYEINEMQTVIKMNNHDYIIDKVAYLPQLYGSCIAVEIILKDAIQS